jgi:curved DNA-binding protein CbpA
MNYFKNIESFADLKKQYRALAFANHPDRGGNTLVM